MGGFDTQPQMTTPTWRLLHVRKDCMDWKPEVLVVDAGASPHAALVGDNLAAWGSILCHGSLKEAACIVARSAPWQNFVEEEYFETVHVSGTLLGRACRAVVAEHLFCLMSNWPHI